MKKEDPAATRLREYVRSLGSMQKGNKQKFRDVRVRARSCEASDDAPLPDLSLIQTEINLARSNLRHLMLAYAMIRGKEYEAIERSCHEKPKPYDIWRWLGKAAVQDQYDREQIIQWLQRPTPQTASEL